MPPDTDAILALEISESVKLRSSLIVVTNDAGANVENIPAKKESQDT